MELYTSQQRFCRKTGDFLYTEILTLLAVLALAYFGHNMTVVYAAGIVLALKAASALGLTAPLAALGSHGLNWGIILLTAAILVPIATGEITIGTMLDSFKTPSGIVAITAGLLAAIAGGGGVKLLASETELIPALIIGTMVGVIAFKGVAVGPLIAGGLTYFVMFLMKDLP